MKKLIALIFVCLIGLLLSCQLVLDIELPSQPAKLVINSIVTTDCVMNVDVRRSANILDTTGIEYAPIPNATIIISDEQGNKTKLQMYSNNSLFYGIRYRSNNIALPGKTYTLNADVPGFESVEAKTRIPDLVKNVQASVDSLNSTPMSLIFNIKFLDDPTQKNYYETYYLQKTKFTYLYPDGNGQMKEHTTIQWYRFRIYYEYTDHMDYKSLFSDSNCSSGQCSLKGFIKDFYAQGEVLEAKIEILNINPEHYEYLTTSHLQSDTYNDPTSQPVQVFNNIKNGYGIFSGLSKTYFILK